MCLMPPLIIGSIHGNECMGAALVLETIEWLLDGYGDDDLATELIDGTEIVFVPLVNPDGYADEPAHRGNANGVDLNRNLGFAWLEEGDGPFSEPETQALRAMGDDASFTLGLSYHTVANYVNGPWNYTPQHPRDEALVQAMGDAYAAVFGFVKTHLLPFLQGLMGTSEQS